MIKSVLPLSLVFSFGLSPVALSNSIQDKLSFGIGSSGSGTTAPNLIAQEIPAVQQEGFVFKFLDCETTPNTDVPLTCEFMIKNSQELERSLRLYGGSTNYSRIIDTSGNEIIASFAQIGRSSGTNYATTDLPSDIPLKASLSFPEAPEGGIEILDIRLYTSASGHFDVEFRFAR